jgi:formylglycine-generating enzyme required for sulfatase activity
MVLIPAGPFQMGSNQPMENPIHTVTLNSFWMDVYEVTNARYAECVAAKKCQPPASNQLFSTRSDYYTNGQYANYPVLYVSWDDANAYCTWRGARLPTEAEWEKAARGGLEGKLYPWGDTAPVCTPGAINGAQFGGCTVQDTVTVGSFKPNRYGVYDMAGNVWEWANDWSDENYYSSSSGNNPIGPPSGNQKVLRGGSWGLTAGSMRVTYRTSAVPTLSYFNVGFRCARSQ